MAMLRTWVVAIGALATDVPNPGARARMTVSMTIGGDIGEGMNVAGDDRETTINSLLEPGFQVATEEFEDVSAPLLLALGDGVQKLVASAASPVNTPKVVALRGLGAGAANRPRKTMTVAVDGPLPMPGLVERTDPGGEPDIAD
jgi:hypothetical protein